MNARTREKKKIRSAPWTKEHLAREIAKVNGSSGNFEFLRARGKRGGKLWGGGVPATATLNDVNANSFKQIGVDFC